MGEKKKAPVLLTPEQKYEEYQQLFECMTCMTITEEKVQLYKTMAKEFKGLGDLGEASTYAEKCEKLAKETAVLVKDEKLEKARKLISQAISIDDLRKADKLLMELSEYKDSADLRKQWEVALAKQNIKSKRGLYMFYAGIVIIIGLLISSRTNVCRYQIGKFLMNTGHYGYAADIFTDLGDYKDTNQKIAEIEQKLIQSRDVGNKIKIGKCDWVIIEKLDNKALVIKDSGIKDLAYSTSGDVTWEKSDVREYLNATFITETFRAEELAYIVDTTISGDTDTTDKLFILSEEEQRKYQNIFEKKKIKHKNNSWLRTVGTREGFMVFVNPEGIIMEEGYAADSTAMITVPAFWYQY